MQHADRQLADPGRAEALSVGGSDGAGAGRKEVAFGWRLAAWCAVAALLGLAVIQYSLREDRLSAAPDWDDVMYMRYAATRVNELYSEGVRACLAGWVRETPHSPWSCGLAFVSFLLFGLREWAPYAGSVLVVVGFLVLVDRVMGRQRFGVKVLTALYLCSVPMMVLTVSDYKPDIAWGLGTAAVAALCVMRPVVGASARYLLGLGALCAVTLLTKPTTTPGALALLGLCGAVGTAKDWVIARPRPRVRDTLRAWGLVLLAMVAVAGPFYYAHWGYFAYYIKMTLFGEYSSTWHIEGGWPAQLKYFITGYGGAANLGGHIYVIPVVWLVGCAVVLARRDFAAAVRLVAMGVVMAACYLMPTVNPAKNTFLAAPFFATVIAVTAYLVGYVARAARQEGRAAGTWGVYAGLLAMVAVGPFLFQWPGSALQRPAAVRADSRRLHGAILDELRKHAKPYPQLLTVTATGPVREITLSWYATIGREPFKFDRPYSNKVADFEAYADRADFVLAQEDGVLGSVSIMPNDQPTVQNQVLEMMRRRDDYRLLTDFTAVDGKKLYLFQRTRWTRGVLRGVRAAEGFGPVRGPYPELNLPQYIWGTGTGSTLLLVPERSGPAVLRMECRATQRVESMRVVSGSTVLLEHRFKVPWQGEEVEVRVPAAEQGGALRFEFVPVGHARLGATEDAVQFRKLELVPAAAAAAAGAAPRQGHGP